MKRKFMTTIFSLLICLTLTNVASEIINFNEQENINFTAEGVKENIDAHSDVEVTMLDIANFLQTKKNHYPLSDEFIERYQQKSGGYIENATKAGLTVNKLLHEPNQKWHFFESWLYPSIEDETLSWEETAKSRVYNKLLCPELLLWIYEACDVAPAKVKAAKEIAEAARVANTNLSTMAKDMRSVVPWEDLEASILDFMNNDYNPYKVNVAEGEGFVITGLEEEYRQGNKVTFSVKVTDDTKLIDKVMVNGEVITPSGSIYSFIMPNTDVTISVTLKDIIAATSVNLSSKELTIIKGKTETISWEVSPSNTTDTPTWSIVEGEDVISITPNSNSVSIKGLKAGSAKIKVVYNDAVSAECAITVEKSDSAIFEGSIATYNIRYDLGDKVSSIKLNDSTTIFNTFELEEGGEKLISSVDAFDYIYGGVYGGGSVASGTRWYAGDVLKFGTQSNNGYLTLGLKTEVNQVRITGYVSDETCALRLGSSTSSDWNGTGDGLTTLFNCTGMSETSKEVIEGKITSTVTINFQSTDSLRIQTTNLKPFYIAKIEFIYNEN